MTFKLLSIILSVYLIGSINCATCPVHPEVIAPCKCVDSKDIECGGNGTINLKKIFHALEFELGDKKKDFRRFLLTNSWISELEENTFNEITFEKINILAKNLSSIHNRAFEGTNKKITSFSVINTALTSKDSNHDPFDAISSMNLLEELDISNSQLEEVPKQAFKPLNGQQTQLTSIKLVNNKISKIGDLAFFHVPALKELSLSGNLIDQLSGDTLDIEKSSENMLSIDLSSNKLDSKSFDVTAFGALNRPASLNLKDNPDLTFLNKQVFKSFLDIKPTNQIEISTLDCIDEKCNTFWLFDSPAYTKRTSQIICSDGKLFRDSTHWPHCNH